MVGNVISDELVSIIVPCKTIDAYAVKCVEVCLSIDYKAIEIILLPDSPTDKSFPKTRIVPTGPVVPGIKRNIGIDLAQGEYVAFLDSDAYPRHDWLTNAVKHLQRENVIGVGGPGVTPHEDNYLQRAGGMVYESPLMGGLSRRYVEASAVESQDIHSCNFIVKKDALTGVRWSERYWPGEDTLFCLDLLKRHDGVLLEAGDVLIYHHRRPLFRRHLRQVRAFGLHRGFFAKRFPENSRKLVYMMPLALAIGLTSITVLAFFIPFLWYLVGAALLGYAVGAILPSFRKLWLFPLVFIGLIATHYTYGISYLQGLLKKELIR